MCRNIGKNIHKNLRGKYCQKLLNHAKQSATHGLKTTSKRVIQKQQKQLVIWLVIRLLTELLKSQEVHHRIIQKQLDMKMLRKYLKEEIYLHKKDRKLLMIWE